MDRTGIAATIEAEMPTEAPAAGQFQKI